MEDANFEVKCRGRMIAGPWIGPAWFWTKRPIGNDWHGPFPTEAEALEGARKGEKEPLRLKELVEG